MESSEEEEIELDLLLEAIHRKYGYDFRNYARGSIKRRLWRRVGLSGLDNLPAMMHRILRDKPFFETVLQDCSISVTSMFRDPMFFRVLREEVFPFLRTYPFIRIWVPGCSTGEEVYSLAILLKEEGLYDRSQIYATDFNAHSVETAKVGIYPVKSIQVYTGNYQQAGGLQSFTDYYTADHQSAILDPELRDNIVFAQHNLATDEVFNEMQLITCRNVLIYFNSTLKSRVLGLFHQSLCRDGFLGLGSQESIQFSPKEAGFDAFHKQTKIYRKCELP